MIIYKKKQRAEFLMLDRCPYYETCEAEIRHALGNMERYCLGAINWEYCSQFNKIELNENSEGRNAQLKRIAQEIHTDLEQKFQDSIQLAFISFQGDVLYRDREWTSGKLELIENLTRILFPYMNNNDSYILKNGENLVFLKLQDSILLVGAVSKEVENLRKEIQGNLTKYRTMLENYFAIHPIEK